MRSSDSAATSAAGARPITIAVVALGGQGGGVLSNWIVAAAEAAGYLAQYTSVPGVAQRTGSTVYCIELFPRAAAEKAGREPVLALMPMPGDVDVVIASELMEAGRAIMRGFVTPRLTTFIVSTHRDYAISEKSALGSGMADGESVMTAARTQSKRLVAFDMKQAAERAGSMISASLLGALAGSEALPISRERFEDSIRISGRTVEANLAAFTAAYERAQSGEPDEAEPASIAAPRAEPKSAATRAIVQRINAEFPPVLRDVLMHGARRCVDYQDPDYAVLYLDRVAEVMSFENGHQDRNYSLTFEFSRHLALRMTYEDTIRVADLKTRAKRFQRSWEQLEVRRGEVVELTEYMHPRFEEIADTSPAPIGRWMLRSRIPKILLGPFLRKGRHVRTTRLSHFLLLRTVASLRGIRRSTLRYKTEEARIDTWHGIVARCARYDYNLAVEVSRCQSLVKGYGETYERGLDKFNRLMEALQYLQDRNDAASCLAELHEAALADEEGTVLEESLARFRPRGGTSNTRVAG